MARGKRISMSAGVAAIALLIAGCGGTTASDPVRSQHVDRATFTGRWPLTVDGGTIACDVSKGGSITFSPDGTSDVYAENGTAMGGWAKQNGWKDFHDIWAPSDDPSGLSGPNINASDLDAIGQKLCDEANGTTAAATATTTTTTTTTDAPPQPVPPDTEGALRGFMSHPDVWDRLFSTADPSQCTAEGFDGLSPQFGWRLPGGALACVGNPSFGAWDGRVVTLTVYFDPPVYADSALQQIAAIFPADTAPPKTNPGINTSAAKDPTGSCEDAVFTSAALGAAATHVLPSWTGAPSKSTVSLYSGGNADGSDSVFRAGSVRQALIGLHDSGPDPTGC